MTTAPRTLARLAARCVADCFPNNRKELVFGDKESTAAATALTSIITAAQYAEHIVEASALMGKLQVYVIVKSTQPDRRTSQMILWNSIEDIPGALNRGAIELLEESGSHQQSNQNQTSSQLPQPGPVPTTQPIGARTAPTTGRTVRVQQSTSPVPTIPPLIQDTENPFIIPRSTAFEVASKILAGSGYYTHNSNAALQWPECYSELYCKHVTLILQRIYETEKILSGKPDMRYENLIPDHLLLKPVTIDGLNECSRHRKGRIPDTDRFILDISNRRATQKHIAFAAICITYEKTYGENSRAHAAKAVLEKFRKEGDSEIGCNRYRERAGKVKVNACARSSDGSCLQNHPQQQCQWNPNHLPLFKDNDGAKEVMALGTINVTVDQIRDVAVPDGSVALTLTHLLTTPAIILDEIGGPPPIHEDSEETVSPMTQISVGYTLAWRKENMPRVDILFNFKRPIGDAILVSYLMSRTPDEPFAQHQEAEDHLPVVASYQATDPSQAAVICDLNLYRERRDLANLPYPYAEWYTMTPFRDLAALHFNTASASSVVPKMMSALPKGRGFLWHRDWIRSANGNTFTSLNEADERLASVA